MQIQARTNAGVAIVEPAGLIDTRSSTDFEKKIVQLLEGGARSFAIDLSKVDLITSSGIRVLVMLAQRLHGLGGGLVLYALSAPVKNVFDVSGLTRQFQIAASQEEAVSKLPAPAAAAAPAASKVSRFARHLLGGASPIAGAPARPARPKSQLSSKVGELLDTRREPRRRSP